MSPDGVSLEFPDLLAARWKCLGSEAAMDHLTLQRLHLRHFDLSLALSQHEYGCPDHLPIRN